MWVSFTLQINYFFLKKIMTFGENVLLRAGFKCEIIEGLELAGKDAFKRKPVKQLREKTY